jgi:DNA-binding NarL/FixJ family response regulator
MSAKSRIRVLSVDDHPLMREGIAAMIRNQADMLLVADAATGREAIGRFREHQPDVTLMDIRLPDMSGIDALIAIRSELVQARIVMLTTFEGDAEIQRALQAGARGYMLKSRPPNELLEGIREVHAGKRWIPPGVAAQLAEHLGEETLTPRELRVLQEVAGGNKNRDIAGPRQAHHGKAGRQGPHGCGRHCLAPRDHPVIGSGEPGLPRSGDSPRNGIP